MEDSGASGMANLSLRESGSNILGEESQGSPVNMIRDQALGYLNSFQGNDALGCNSDHAWFQRLVEGGDTDGEHKILSNVLCYRMSIMKLTTYLKDYLNLPIPDGRFFGT
jgi:hypothetical protein